MTQNELARRKLAVAKALIERFSFTSPNEAIPANISILEALKQLEAARETP